MFNHDLYDSQRVKYKCLDAFPEVFDKIKPEKGIVDLRDILEKENEAFPSTNAEEKKEE